MLCESAKPDSSASINSDVDHLAVFVGDGKRPQTYLDRLRSFANARYPRSVVRQAHPTIVLELEHIQFDLVGAIESLFSGLRIPGRQGEWLESNPTKMFNKMASRDASCDGLLRPATRLVELWNSLNGRVYSSFELETAITGEYYPDCVSLADYVLTMFENLPDSEDQAQLVNVARTRAAGARMFLKAGVPSLAQEQLSVLLSGYAIKA